MNRRGFWKYLAAVPVAAVAPIVGARALPEVDAAGITIEGTSVVLSNCSIVGAGITIKPGVQALVSGCYITKDK